MNKKIAIFTYALATLLLFQAGDGIAGAKSFTPHRLTYVMTYNLDMRTDVTPIFAATNEAELIAAVGQA